MVSDVKMEDENDLFWDLGYSRGSDPEANKGIRRYLDGQGSEGRFDRMRRKVLFNEENPDEEMLRDMVRLDRDYSFLRQGDREYFLNEFRLLSGYGARLPKVNWDVAPMEEVREVYLRVRGDLREFFGISHNH